MKAEAVFKIDSWEEEPFAPVDVGDKLTRVSVVKSYSGDIEGEGRLEYLMQYRKGRFSRVLRSGAYRRTYCW